MLHWRDLNPPLAGGGGGITPLGLVDFGYNSYTVQDIVTKLRLTSLASILHPFCAKITEFRRFSSSYFVISPPAILSQKVANV